MDKNAIALGLQIGRIISGQRRKKAPVAYLYGPSQKRLPVLPKIDKNIFPFTLIFSVNLFGALHYYILASSTPLTYHKTASFYGTADGKSFQYLIKNDEWVEDTDSEYAYLAGELATSGAMYMTGLPWANYDVYEKGTDTVYREASEPVPVYE